MPTNPLIYKGRRTLPASTGQIDRAARQMQKYYEQRGWEPGSAEDQANEDIEVARRIKPYQGPTVTGGADGLVEAQSKPRWHQYMKKKGVR